MYPLSNSKISPPLSLYIDGIEFNNLSPAVIPNNEPLLYTKVELVFLSIPLGGIDGQKATYPCPSEFGSTIKSAFTSTVIPLVIDS